ncbi:MAG: histidinol-phosphate aminotransferase family protein [Deltaproteobacteria bacterium]|nr:histidinol-phosphate aminotransferase family protein [Deltaproteobacteria bacterium]
MIHSGTQVRFQPELVEGPKPSRHVRGLAPYDAVSSLSAISRLPEGTVPLKLDWNESAIPPSPRVIEAITAFLGNTHNLNWYSDLQATSLREALAVYTGVSADHMLVTNGSDDALALVCYTFLDAGDDVLVVWPTYGHFMVFARARGVEPRIAAEDDLFANPTESVLSRMTERTKLVYFASPNNPTGVVTPPDDVARMCNSHPGTLFLVDEAYYEFSGVSSAKLVESCPNLVVTRTFSKCLGIAGLRVGYMMAGDPILDHLRKLHNPKSVNSLGQVGALAALSDRDYIDGYIRDVRKAGLWFQDELRARGADARTTDANFLLVRVADPGALVAALESVGVFIRDRSHIKGFDGYVRFTLGTPGQMKDLTHRIDGLLAARPDLLKPYGSG